jgi:hypothetical protein
VADALLRTLVILAMKNTALVMFFVVAMAAPLLKGAASQAPVAPAQFEVASVKPNQSPVDVLVIDRAEHPHRELTPG